MLGFGIFIWKESITWEPWSTSSNSLTNLAVLEEIYIHDEDSDLVLEFSDPESIPWHINGIGLSICPKLRIFGLHNFNHHDRQKWYEHPIYLPYRIENVLGEPLPDIVATFTGIDVRTLLTLVEIDISEEKFDHTAYPSLEALSITLRIQETKSETLAWVGSLVSLTQLSLYDKGENPTSAEQYGSTGRELALANKRLRYLKIDDFAWRVWHGLDHGEGNVCHLERLDRFECREVQAFQSRRRFHVTQDE